MNTCSVPRIRTAAASSLGVLAILHLVYLPYAAVLVAPLRDSPLNSFDWTAMAVGWMAVVILTAWLALGVRRGNRSAGGLIVSVFLLIGAAVRLALLAHHPQAPPLGFYVVDLIYAMCAITASTLCGIMHFTATTAAGPGFAEKRAGGPENGIAPGKLREEDVNRRQKV